MPPKHGPRELTAEDFDAIREAVMETPRGRWFLDEYASRLKTTDTDRLLDGMKRLERAVSANHDAVMTRLAAVLRQEEETEAPSAATAPVPQPDLAPRHMKYFRTDEDVFEAAPHATIAAVPGIPRTEAPTPGPQPAARTRNRIVIIRHQPGDTIEVPLLDEMAKAS